MAKYSYADNWADLAGPKGQNPDGGLCVDHAGKRYYFRSVAQAVGVIEAAGLDGAVIRPLTGDEWQDVTAADRRRDDDRHALAEGVRLAVQGTADAECLKAGLPAGAVTVTINEAGV